MGQLSLTRSPSFFAKAVGIIWFPPFKRKTSIGNSATPRNLRMADFHNSNKAEAPLPP
jgi:hypothetical protein